MGDRPIGSKTARGAQPSTYLTRGGVRIEHWAERIPTQGAIEPLLDLLDSRRGAVYASSVEVPGRYARWDRGFVDPPLVVEARARSVSIRALNARGRVLRAGIDDALAATPIGAWKDHDASSANDLNLHVPPAAGSFPEERRSRQPSVFSVLRALVELFMHPDEQQLGLYGAFGYDLAFQFEPLRLARERDPNQRDLVLYLPDELIAVDHRLEHAVRLRYDFELAGRSTSGLPRDGGCSDYHPSTVARGADHEPGEYAQVVRRARQAFARGDLFEVVPSQVLSEASPAPPSQLFRRLRERNPSPYGFLINLGRAEYLVGASPEMYVRVSRLAGDPPSLPSRPRFRVETCPIAGTIARGRDALEDADQIRSLLNSAKDESELTMCTDVDRNDKSRVCEPGSVRVLGRRQIELYSRLIHTVDHVEGILEPQFDALDAFLAHAWAVTVTGAPKAAAMRFIEEHELSPRRWYGGAAGSIGFDGSLNTGLVLRTIRIADGTAEIRVGATTLYESDPEAEEQETLLKASALLDALRRPVSRDIGSAQHTREGHGDGKRVLIVDAQDSFVHTLGSYFRRTGAEVKTLRAGFPPDDLRRLEPDLVVLSPGPGRPSDFDLERVVAAALQLELPLFGVCLGLQAIAEHFGGQLSVLPVPVHGKSSRIQVTGDSPVLFREFPAEFRAGRYHSLHVVRSSLPEELRVTATDGAGLVMAIEHRRLAVAAVQFHPESILTAAGDLGMRLVANTIGALPIRPRKRVSRKVLPGRW
jgi:anthranilate synthase